MNIIYEVPSGEWVIVEQSDPVWQSVFGTDATYYNAYRKKDKLLVFSGLNISSVLQWFRKMNIISQDELENQIQKIGK